MNIKPLLMTLLLASSINASDNATLTNISFSSDDNGNLNPTIFIPIYYGDYQQFYSSVAYSSSNVKEVGKVTGFTNSKNALVSSARNVELNYITYKTNFLGFDVSFGAQSSYKKQENNEFGYINDSANLFGNGADYYIAFDNSIELEILRHALRGDILVPFGKYFVSRLSTTVSPYTSIDLKQSTIFKPLVNETGTSSSSSTQNLAYDFKYEIESKTGKLFDIGLKASYAYQPLNYDVVALAQSGSNYVFNNTHVDTNEVTTKYSARVILNRTILGGLNPSLGYGVVKLKTKNNLNGKTISTNNKVFSFSVEKRF